MDIRTIWYTKIWPWMKRWWVVIFAHIVIVIAEVMIWDHPEVEGAKWLLGGWLVFGTLVGVISFVRSLIGLNPQPEPPKPTR